MNTVKGIIFDYGGTIDTDGTHWGEVIWEEYHRTSIPIGKEQFREAYIHGERTLAKHPIIAPTDTFHTLLEKKIDIQFGYIDEKHPTIRLTTEKKKNIVEGCYNRILSTMQTTRRVIEELSQSYPMVLVTNFYGNMNTVLKEFDLADKFPIIIESSVVGIRKPDPALFAMGVQALKTTPTATLVVGDSYRKDIFPAHTIGCRTAWLKGIGWEEEHPHPNAHPTAIIKSLSELPYLLRKQR